ncbi:AAA family ATPase [Kitasatospora paranensis]|uniref:AAA family ATPase n=1 Tax=Kitasatospora paranensis TaxID=258053 RepID=A0ABW2G759_9ACTN
MPGPRAADERRTAPPASTAPPDTIPLLPTTPLHPAGLVDLRGRPGPALSVHYPADAVVVVSGLPGSGKSTLLGRWSDRARVVDPRVTHLDCEAVMPGWLPYAAYRPWARLRHLARLRAAVRAGGPLLVHDCGSRPWLRRWLARGAARRGRTLHLVLLDVGADVALTGQESRQRWASGRVFAGHRRGLGRLLAALAVDGRGAVPEAASLLLLDRVSRERAADVGFAGPGAG